MGQEDGMAAELLEDTALVVRFDGSLQETNYEEWRDHYLKVIGTFNLNPATAEECGKAKEDAKKCKAVEDAIEAVIDEIMAQNTALNQIIKGARELQEAFSKARTAQNTAITAFATKQKEALVDEYISLAKTKVEGSPVAYVFQVNTAEIRACIKGKSSEAPIRKALAAEVKKQLDNLQTLETTYKTNMVLIEKAEAEHPGVAPDRKTLALKNPEAVEAMLEARAAQAEAVKAKRAAEAAAAEATQKAQQAGEDAPSMPQACSEHAPAQEEKQAPTFAGLNLSGKAEIKAAPVFAGLNLSSKVEPEKAPATGCKILVEMSCDEATAQPLVEYLKKMKHVVSAVLVEACSGVEVF